MYRLPPVVDGLANLSPYIREHADTVNFLDINPASRSAVSFNGTVKALPLDTDYIAIGWRQDVFFKHGIGLEPPKTIEELADLSERLNGLDHNDDGEADWGVCLTPQVNYFYAFVAPIFQTQLHNTNTGRPTGQNIFFDTQTFEPLIRVPGFRHALEQYWRVIRSSNCQTQLTNGEKCDRKSAFPTGRCAMVISMPGTLTSMLLENGSRSPKDRYDEFGNVTWSIRDQPVGADGTYWGRRAPFPGSKLVQSWDRSEGRTLMSCDEDGDACPLADANGINYAPFFSEGGEAYALNGRQSKPSARTVMWDVFAWLSELPVTALPLSGQYRKSQLNSEAREELLREGDWPEQMVDDLFALLGEYFRNQEEGGNPVQDLLMLGFPEYMGALDDELHNKLLGVHVDSDGGFFNKQDPSMSIDPVVDATIFDKAYSAFLDALEERYNLISTSVSGGPLAQLQRWRQSLNLAWINDVDLCSAAISIDANAFRRLGCDTIVNFENLCQTQFHDVFQYDPELCSQYYGDTGVWTKVLVPSIVVTFLFLCCLTAYFFHQRNGDMAWTVKSSQLDYGDAPQVIGQGSFGVVRLAEYRGTKVAVKECLSKPSSDPSSDFMPSAGLGSANTEQARPRLIRSDSTESFGTAIHSLTSSLPLSTQPMKGLGRLLRSRTYIVETEFVEEMRILSKLRHKNITTIMGAVMEGEKPKLVMEYMELGSLYDVLHNKTVSLDGDLLLPILQEIAHGVRYLHTADPPIIHSDLKSKNILINSKYSAKVSDFGLSLKGRKGPKGTALWMAPEVLCGENNTTASDVYAFGIILYEVFSRKMPYQGEPLAAVIKGVKDPHVQKRPPVPHGCPEKMGNLMKECVQHDPKARPTFEEIDLLLQRMSAENVEPGEMNLSVLARKERKANRANNLLYDVFPPHIAEALRDGRKVEAESHDEVSIFFSDIVGFTTISESLTARKTCDMVDRLYHQFDALTFKHEIFKIDVVGDAYMATTNLVKDQSSDHVLRLAQFSLDAIKVANQTPIDPDDPTKGFVQIRVGFNTGPVISDVVGSRLPKYSVFGDAVNVGKCTFGIFGGRSHPPLPASRMESSSAAGRVQCSEGSAMILLKQAPDFPLECRGRIKVKGKGSMRTFWVNEPEVEKEELIDI